MRQVRVATVALAAMLTPLVATVSGCGWGCDAELTVERLVVHGNGRPRVDLDLSARITDDGKPVEGVAIEFFGVGPDGIIMGDATSGPDGLAHLHVAGGVGPESAGGWHADAWTAYRARVSVIQRGDRAAATICAEEADAPFSYQP